MKTYIDTNILYYKYENKRFPIQLEGQNITSITALEFLKNIEKKHNNRARYFIPKVNFGLKYLAFISQSDLLTSRNHPLNQAHSDSIIFDFKQDFESYALFNNESVALVLNKQLEELFYISIGFLSKSEYKDIKNKYNFLLKNSIHCESISANDIELAYSLLDIFLKSHSIKQDFRNSWNDILILARAINEGGRLISTDKLLNRFAAEVAYGTILKSSKILEIQFSSNEAEIRKMIQKQDSKGYVNRGWQYKIRSGK